jgi:antitoxin (DNA-binding transcriptional repressor) of toxin-antitoxin stability system
MTQIALEQAGPALERLVREAQQGEEIILTTGDRPVARLVAILAEPELEPRQPGNARGQVLYMADDFDAPLSTSPSGGGCLPAA